MEYSYSRTNNNEVFFMPSINFIDPFANNGAGKIVKTIEFNNERDKDSGILISRYEEEGFKNRAEYLNSLREEYGAEVFDAVSSVMPPSEDFDGLITELEDFEETSETARLIEGCF